MLVTKVSSLQTRAREHLSMYRTHHYGQIRCQLHILLPMPCHAVFRSIIVLCCSNIVFLHPKSKYIWLLIRSLMLWRLDPWLIDYGGVSWLPFNMWTIKSLASLSKCKYESLCPDYAARCTSIKKFWQLSWMILMWARLLSKLFHRLLVRSSISTLLYYISLLSRYRFSMQTPNMNWTMTKIVEFGNKLIISDPSPLG